MERSNGSRVLAAMLVVALVAFGCGRGDGPAVDEAPAAPAPGTEGDGVPLQDDEEFPEVDTSGWDVAADLAAIQAHFAGLAAAFDRGVEAGFAARGASHLPALTAEQYLACLFGPDETFALLAEDGYRLRTEWSALEPDPDFVTLDDVRLVDEGFRVYFGIFVEYETFLGEEDAFEFEDTVAIHPDGRIVTFECEGS